MPKAKTHKGLKKVLNKRQSGSITKSSGGVNHMTGKRSSKVTRNKRKNTDLSNADIERFKKLI